MVILVAVAVGLMISTLMSLPAYGAKRRHSSPYGALCSVVNKAGTVIYAHICMNNRSSVSVACVLVYCSACVGAHVDWHNTTVPAGIRWHSPAKPP